MKGMSGRTWLQILKSAGLKWNKHNAPRLGASLAYYALLSIAPLAIFTVAGCGLILDRSQVERELLAQVRSVAGYSAADTVRMLIENAHASGSGPLATAIAFLTLLFGASGVFVELRDSLNTIWEAPRKSSSGWRGLVLQRLVSFAMVLALGLLLFVSLLFSASATFAEKFVANYLPMHFSFLGQMTNNFVSFFALVILFGLIFKFVPDVPIAWTEVGIGALVTAVLFSLGKALLALYLRRAGIGSTYGAAGSLVALVVWVYYSAQIFFFGAVITRAYADRLGPRDVKRQRAEVKKQTIAAGHQLY
jgi:membrane protein